jgi:hypothetical protein
VKLEPKLMTRDQMDRVIAYFTAQAGEPDRPISRADVAAVLALMLGHLAVVTDRLSRDVDIQAIPVPL